MGWKTVKDRLGITESHLHVHMVDGNLHFGSGYITDLMVFSPDGKLVYSKTGFASEKLDRIKHQLLANPQSLREMLACEDDFNASVVVYTYVDGQIVERFCECPGYPGVTHNGELMMDSTHFANKQDAINRAKASVASGIRNFQAALEVRERELAQCKAGLESQLAEQAELNRLYP